VVRFFNGLTEIRPHAVKRTGVGSFPEPVQVGTGRLAASGELFEGLLVRISDATIIGSIPSSGNANLTIDDGSGPVALRIDKDTNIPGMATPSEKVHVTGVVGQFDTALPYHSGYQVLPRSTADIEITTAVDAAEMSEIPREFSLAQNYPNPFNGETIVDFAVPRQSQISLKIYDVTGRLIRILMDGAVPSGMYRHQWNGRDNSGERVGSGIYFYRLSGPGFSKTGKMVLID
ncbi:MAG: T9SS type A sorting domain-containing protein, partial [bacterium]